MAAPIVIQAQLDMGRMRSDLATVTSSVDSMSPGKIYKEMSRAADMFVKKIEAVKINSSGGSFFKSLLSGAGSYVAKVGEAKIAWQTVYDAQIRGGKTAAEANEAANTMQARSVAEMSSGLSKLAGTASVLAQRFGAGKGVAGAIGVAAVGVGALFVGFKAVTAVIGGIGSVLSSIGSAISSVGSALASAFSFVWDIGKSIVTAIGGALKYVGGLIGSVFSSAFGYVRDIVWGVFSWMKNTVFSAVGAWLGTVTLGVGVLALAGSRLNKTFGGGVSAAPKAEDDPTKNFGFLQNVIEASGEAISRFIDKVQTLVGGWFAGAGSLVEYAAEGLSAAIDWIIPKLQSVIVSVLQAALTVISIADSIAGAVYALFSGDFAAAGAMIINTGVKVVEAMQGIIKMLAPAIDWIVSKVAILAGGVLSLVARGVSMIESTIKITAGMVLKISGTILSVIIAISGALMNFIWAGSGFIANAFQQVSGAVAEKGAELERSAGRGDWTLALEGAAKTLSDSGAAGVDAAGAMEGVLGDLAGWMRGVSTGLDADAEKKYGGLLDPAKDAIEKLLKSLGTGSVAGTDAAAAAAAAAQGKGSGANAVDTIDSVIGSIKIGEDKALNEQKKGVSEQRKTNVLLSQIATGGGALT